MEINDVLLPTEMLIDAGSGLGWECFPATLMVIYDIIMKERTIRLDRSDILR